MEHIRSETRNVLMLQYAILLLAVVSLAALACVAAENGVFGEKAFRVEDTGALHEAVNCFGVGVKCFIIYRIYRSHFFRGSFRIAVNLLLISAFFNAAWRILVSLGIYYCFDSSVAAMSVYCVCLIAAVIIEKLTALAGLDFVMRGFGTALDNIGEKTPKIKYKKDKAEKFVAYINNKGTIYVYATTKSGSIEATKLGEDGTGAWQLVPEVSKKYSK